MSEHKGRYRPLQHLLAEAGVATFALDLRGFGESGAPRTHVDSFHQYLDDLSLAVEYLRSEYPLLPLFLIGHSMGGLISLTYCIRDRPVLGALIVSAPVVLHPPPPLRIRVLAYLLTRLMPRHYFVYRNQVQNFSHDPKVIEAFKNDPLCQNAGTPRFYTELQRMRRYLLQEASRLSLPILILQGTGDTIVLPQGARLLYERVSSSDRRLIEYEGFYHEPFNELGREQVFADILAWLNARIL